MEHFHWRVEGKWAPKCARNSTFRWWKQAVHQKRAISGVFRVLKGVVVTTEHQPHIHTDMWLVLEGRHCETQGVGKIYL